jgi:hypothetical protein
VVGFTVLGEVIVRDHGEAEQQSVFVGGQSEKGIPAMDRAQAEKARPGRRFARAIYRCRAARRAACRTCSTTIPYMDIRTSPEDIKTNRGKMDGGGGVEY